MGLCCSQWLCFDPYTCTTVIALRVEVQRYENKVTSQFFHR